MSLIVVKLLDHTTAGRCPTCLSPVHALKPPVPGKQTQRNLRKDQTEVPVTITGLIHWVNMYQALAFRTTALSFHADYLFVFSLLSVTYYGSNWPQWEQIFSIGFVSLHLLSFPPLLATCNVFVVSHGIHFSAGLILPLHLQRIMFK